MNKNKLHAMIHRVSQETGIVYNSVFAYYFMEDILLRIYKSNYKENFIFKGGFLLSNIVGISSRATVDMDFQLENEQLSESNIKHVFDKILKETVSDVDYTIDSIKPIKEADFYGGFRVMLLAKLDNLRQHVPIDIATGDIVTPHPINYEYRSIFDNEMISIKAYSIETTLAEKLETIYSRGFTNSRIKDYFDLYLIWKMKSEEIDNTTLQTALTRTFSYRDTEYDLIKIENLLSQLDNPIFIERWEAYRKKNNFVGNLSFQDVLKGIFELIDFIE